MDPAHVDAPGVLRSLLGDRGEERGKVIDHADVMSAHYIDHLLRLRAIELLVSAARLREPRRRNLQIGSDDARGAVSFSQGGRQLGTNLTERSGD